MENYSFLENYVTSQGAISHNVLYYQPLPITHFQVSFYAYNYVYFELPIVSTVFNNSLAVAVHANWDTALASDVTLFPGS